MFLSRGDRDLGVAFQTHPGRQAFISSGGKEPRSALGTKVHLVKAMVFPVVMYGCESWTVKKAECRRIDAFELWCWRRLLRVPWTARRSNQSIHKNSWCHGSFQILHPLKGAEIDPLLTLMFDCVWMGLPSCPAGSSTVRKNSTVPNPLGEALLILPFPGGPHT